MPITFPIGSARVIPVKTLEKLPSKVGSAIATAKNAKTGSETVFVQGCIFPTSECVFLAGMMRPRATPAMVACTPDW